jgi:hypothetical protein
LTNNTGPGFAPATEITGRGSSFANAAPGNLIRFRCVVPGVSSPKTGMFAGCTQRRWNLETMNPGDLFTFLVSWVPD